MKLVSRFAALGGGVAFRRGGSLGLRQSIHLVQSSSQPRDPSDSPAATGANEDTSWVLLNRRGCRRVVTKSSSMAAPDNKTVAESRTSTGQDHLRVSFCLAAPPASSFLYFDYAGGTVPAEGEKIDIDLTVIAAHGDSMVLRMRTETRRRSSSPRRTAPLTKCQFDHFVYKAGTATRPPSLSLLPAVSIPVRDAYCRPVLLDEDTGVLRRGEDEVLVAQLELSKFEHEDTADLSLLHLGRSQWELKRSVPIVHEQGDELLGWGTGASMAIPVGERFLCWVSYHGQCFILADMAAEEGSPILRQVPLPATPYDPKYYTNDLPPLRDSKGMGVAGDGAVRFVAVEPRCCCGHFGRTSCARSHYAFTVTTWTLTLMMDEPLTWVKEGVFDCEELWAMPGYEGIPRGHLRCPIVSLDNPDVVCFKVGKVHNDQDIWMIQVDTRRKALLEAVPWNTDSETWRSGLTVETLVLSGTSEIRYALF